MRSQGLIPANFFGRNGWRMYSGCKYLIGSRCGIDGKKCNIMHWGDCQKLRKGEWLRRLRRSKDDISEYRMKVRSR